MSVENKTERSKWTEDDLSAAITLSRQLNKRSLSLKDIQRSKGRLKKLSIHAASELQTAIAEYYEKLAWNLMVRLGMLANNCDSEHDYHEFVLSLLKASLVDSLLNKKPQVFSNVMDVVNNYLQLMVLNAKVKSKIWDEHYKTNYEYQTCGTYFASQQAVTHILMKAVREALNKIEATEDKHNSKTYYIRDCSFGCELDGFLLPDKYYDPDRCPICNKNWKKTELKEFAKKRKEKLVKLFNVKDHMLDEAKYCATNYYFEYYTCPFKKIFENSREYECLIRDVIEKQYDKMDDKEFINTLCDDYLCMIDVYRELKMEHDNEEV